jgi:hypothetical protein
MEAGNFIVHGHSGMEGYLFPAFLLFSDFLFYRLLKAWRIFVIAMQCMCFIYWRMRQHGMCASQAKAVILSFCYPFILLPSKIMFRVFSGLRELPMQLLLIFTQFAALGSAVWQWDMKCTQELVS